MSFDIQAFLRLVESNVADDFINRHGNGKPVDWQQAPTTIVRDVVDALSGNSWAIGALESCKLIADSGGRDLLRSAGHHKQVLMSGVDNLDANDETCAVWLATEDREVFSLVVSAAQAQRGIGTRSWQAFCITQREPIHAAVGDLGCMERFRIAVERVLHQQQRQLPPWRNLSIDHFEYALDRRDSHSRRPLVQVNVYAETTPRNHEILVDGQLVPVQLPGLYRASLIFDSARRTIEVVAKGGRAVRDALVDAFCKTLLPSHITTDRLARRQINFDLFRSKPQFARNPGDPLCVIDEMRLFSPGVDNGLVTLDCKRQGQHVHDVYSWASTWLGLGNPIGKDGWQIVSVRLRLVFKPERIGKSGRIVTVYLKHPLGTTLRENTNADHAVAERLFKRWGIFGPDIEDE